METIFSILLSNSEAILLFLIFAFLYLLLADFSLQKRWPFYFAGLLLMVLSAALNLVEGTLMPFTTQIGIHMVLFLICGPSMVIGWPDPKGTLGTLLNNGSPFLTSHLFICWMIGIGIMGFWHSPAALHTLMQPQPSVFNFINLLHLASLLLAGVIFSWPVLHVSKDYRIDPPVGIVYLFSACIACALLGMLITFASAYTYRFAMNVTPDGPITAPLSGKMTSDQRAAGLMWIPGCSLYLTGIIYLSFNWIKSANRPKTESLNTTHSSPNPKYRS